MRKLAPVFLTTSILAFAAGNAAAMGDFKKKSPEATTSPSSLSTSTTNQATPPGNSDSSTAGAMKAGEPAAKSTVSPAASPTVSANTQNPQGMSYSDRSSSAPGTNAKMDTAPGTKGVATVSPLTSGSSTDATTALANEDKQAPSRQASGEKSTLATTDATDTTTTSAVKAKKAKKKVATNDNVPGNPPMSSTNAAAAGSGSPQ